MPLWVRTVLLTADPEEVGPATEAHLDRVRELRRQGRVVAAGALVPDAGFLEIFEAADRLEAEAITRDSPLVELGLATWMLREWRRLDPEP